MNSIAHNCEMYISSQEPHMHGVLATASRDYSHIITEKSHD